MPKHIKAGYLLKLTTWENDADNYNTTELDGLTNEEVQFYIMIAKCFESGSNNDQKTLGNTVVWSSYNEEGSWSRKRSVDHTEYLDQKIKEWQEAGNSIPEKWDRTKDPYLMDGEADDTSYFYIELLSDLIGTWNDGEYWRVFESFAVYLVPNQIQDCSVAFKS